MSYSIPHLIQNKRDGLVLSDEEIQFFIRSVTNESIQKSQIGAMLMAMYLKGLNMEETTALTRAMTYSGETLTFPEEWSSLIVDKHSTGGVGDKISLILAPTLAALGFKVPMMSGRGLGFTGGTLDKLESIPGFKTKLTNEEMIKCLESAGCFIAGATTSLAPADAILYQQRDITSTVDCLPLMASSILSKKVAEGTKMLVMDVKIGNGAFCKTEENGRKFADILIQISKGLGVKTKVLLSEMLYPIGNTVGNSVEVLEALQCLQGDGPKNTQLLVQSLAAVLLVEKGIFSNMEDGIQKVRNILQNGKALEHFYKMLICQGVSEEHATGLCYSDLEVLTTILPQAKFTSILSTKSSGYIQKIDAHSIALVCWKLGAGRSKASDPIDHAVGIHLIKNPGDRVEYGQPWIKVLHSKKELDPDLIFSLNESITITNEQPKLPSIIIDII